jgi:hypothetical protein
LLTDFLSVEADGVKGFQCSNDSFYERGLAYSRHAGNEELHHPSIHSFLCQWFRQDDSQSAYDRIDIVMPTGRMSEVMCLKISE